MSDLLGKCMIYGEQLCMVLSTVCFRQSDGLSFHSKEPMDCTAQIEQVCTVHADDTLNSSYTYFPTYVSALVLAPYYISTVCGKP